METSNTQQRHSSTNGSIQSSFKQSCSKVERCVQDDPQKSMLISLGAGLGIGIAFGLMLGGSRRPQTSGWLDRRTAEQLGQRALANMNKWLPDSISDRF